jgi:hypothetical protein
MVKITLKTLQTIREAFPKSKEGITEGELVEGEILRRVFGLVCPAKDWKGQIDSVVSESILEYDREVIARAVEFMTGCPVTFEDTKDGMGFPVVRVRSAGYRAGPAGDR